MPSLEGEKDPKLLVGVGLDVGRKGPETGEKSRVGSWRVSPGKTQGTRSARPRCRWCYVGLYPEGTGDPEAYERWSDRISASAVSPACYVEKSFEGPPWQQRAQLGETLQCVGETVVADTRLVAVTVETGEALGERLRRWRFT